MAKLTIGRMAKLYGLHRSTLYEAVQRGRVTAGRDSQGHQVVDLSEMIRVWGEAPGQTRQHPTASVGAEPDTPTAMQQAMLHELQAMRSELAALRQEVAGLKRLPAPAEKPQRDIEKKTVSSFADLLAKHKHGAKS